ncbi:MAG TPA: NAD-dependent epimerase/dehydratase family protein [Candidatus Paceibacterota bacterium]|nr:NAD-dependent epimerase/dehydratase family protein [Candidatus Paceibacterota bacterium]
MKKAVVTGGAGFIGAHIARALIDVGYETHVVDDLSDGKRDRVPEGATLHVLDVRNTSGIKEIFEGAAAVFHEAALPRVPFSIDHPQEAHDVNVNGTLSVLLAAKEAGVSRVIYAASSSAYGEQATLPLSEDMPALPVNPYGLHKYIGECYARMFSELYGLETVSLRYFNVYGSGMDPEGAYALAIPKLLQLRAKGVPLTITGDGTQTRDFTHIRDVIRANLLAMESPRVGKGEVINIGSGRNVSMNYLAELIGGERVYIPARVEAHDTLADITRAKELLDWEPEVTLEDGIMGIRGEYGV